MTQLQDRIVFADGTGFDLARTEERSIRPYPRGRDWKQMHVVGTVERVKAAFVDGAQYCRQWESQTVVVDPDTGAESSGVELREEDLRAYSVAGEIVDMRDGTVIVYMGKPTELEILQAALAEAQAVNTILTGGEA